MKISTQTRYSIRIMLEIGLKRGVEDVVSIQEICKAQGISEKYAESIAGKLKRIGWLSSTKGSKGGYSIAVEPEEITLGDVMRHMETTFFDVHCVEDPEENCKVYNKCVNKIILERLEKVITETVDAITMQDILNKYIAKNGEYSGICSQICIDDEDLSIFEMM